MTWREMALCRLLLLVAQIIGPSRWARDIVALSNHIEVNGRAAERESNTAALIAEVHR